MKQKNLLILCPDVKNFKKIYKLNLLNYKKIVLVSDDIKVHKECEKIDLISVVSFIRKPISYRVVSFNVKKMIDKVNIYLNKVANKNFFDKKDLFWECHVEGGYTTQILQDTLLAIECAYSIFDNNKISNIILFGQDNLIETEIFKRVAYNKGCKIDYFDRRYIINKNVLKNLIKPIYYLFRSIICKILSNRPKFLKKKNIVLFQIPGISTKHIENNLFSQKELYKNGLAPLNIIWGGATKVKKIENRGYQVISIEYYLKYKQILLSMHKMLLIFCSYKYLKKLFFSKSTFNHRGIDISDIVFKIVFQYLYTDGPENYRYRTAAQLFFKNFSNYIVAIKYSAAKSLPQGRILSEIIGNKYLKFDYSMGLYFYNEYNNYNSKKNNYFLNNNFIRFARNEIEKKSMVKNENVSRSSILKYGSGRDSKHFYNSKFLKKEKSRKKLGIKNIYQFYILLDFQEPRHGYISFEEVIYITNTLVDFVKKNSNICLIIKPYPNSNAVSLIKDLINKRSKNIYLITSISSPDHFLNIADIIFTKFSSLGIESMIYDTQIVSLHLDKEKTFKVFGNAAKYLYKKKDLVDFLDDKLSSKNNFFEWKKSFEDKRKKFINDYYPKLDYNSEKIIAMTLKKYLINLN